MEFAEERALEAHEGRFLRGVAQREARRHQAASEPNASGDHAVSTEGVHLGDPIRSAEWRDLPEDTVPKPEVHEAL